MENFVDSITYLIQRLAKVVGRHINSSHKLRNWNYGAKFGHTILQKGCYLHVQFHLKQTLLGPILNFKKT